MIRVGANHACGNDLLGTAGHTPFSTDPVARTNVRPDLLRAGDGMANKLFYGDNLTVLRDSIATESVDLVYLDPPFN